MKKILFITILALSSLFASAQQEVMVSQYMFNGLFINPAYAGSHKYFSGTLLHRNQWVSFDGAPKTFLVSLDGPIKGEKMGLGFIVAHDKIGVTSQTDINLNYSYNIKLGGGKLAFGLKGGVSNYSVKTEDLKVWDSDDATLSDDSKSEFLPKFGFGMYYYSKKWYAGVSIPTLIAYENGTSFNMNIDQSSFLRKHFLINGGYVFDLNDKLKLKPSTLIKYVKSAPVEVDINCSILYDETIWLGVSYRTNDAIIGIIEYQANKRFRIGYSYDFTLTEIGNYSSGSHEIMIGYDFGKDLVNVKTPRFF
jgi:type IX secretion system PorP/SprF family membrane protein